MSDGACTECGASFEIKGMRTKTCSSECSSNRSRRHANRPALMPSACSECNAQIAHPGHGGKRTTCSTHCASERTRRLKAEWWAANRPVPAKRACPDCQRDISDRRATSIRCYDCQVRYRKGSGNELAKARWSALHADEKGRRKLSYHLRTAYGLTLEEYEAMKLSQGGLCALCGNPPKGRGRQDTLVVDHDHATGAVRALLCGNCNSGLGLFAESPEILRRAADYAARHAAPTLPLRS